MPDSAEYIAELEAMVHDLQGEMEWLRAHVATLLLAWDRLGIHGAASVGGAQSLLTGDSEGGQLLVDRSAWRDLTKVLTALRAALTDGGGGDAE